MLQICICTHNPRQDVFDRVLSSIAGQRCGPGLFEVIIIDNASTPPVSEAACRKRLGAVPFRLVREDKLGLAAARVRAVNETSAEWVLLVDDDTEILPDYVEQGLRIIRENPAMGCFAGKLLLPDYLAPEPWIRPLLGFLAIRDIGDAPITACADHWGVWEPPAAGAFVRRALLERYRAVVQRNEAAYRLGRKGGASFGAGEDALIMRGAYELNLFMSYQPSLKLIHHLDPSRFRFRYLLGLMYGHGRSRIILERLIRQSAASSDFPSGPSMPVRFLRGLYRTLVADPRVSLRYACCTTAYRVGSVSEQLASPGATPTTPRNSRRSGYSNAHVAAPARNQSQVHHPD